MQKGKKSLIFLLVFMLLAGVGMQMPKVNAAEIKKTEKTYEIAVVFDNSGSMYDNKAWCRAKYAMEIFASMLNYNEGDKLKIFPMWEVTTDGSTPKTGGSYAAIDIGSKEDIDKISNMYTVRPSSTPFEPITEAYEYLKTSNATEKWLIVMTDGAFNEDKRGQDASIDLKNRLLALSSQNIKVQYLGFGGAQKLESNAKKFFYAKKSSDTSLKDDLIEICNSIFQRSILPEDRLKGTTLTLDLSMKNLIVFAQGPDAKIMSLRDANGKDIPITLDSGQRTYSEIKAQTYENAPVDKTLAGQVVTFGACQKGTYTLNYTGADKIQIFYEPDVDISVTLTNSDGEVVDGSSDEIVVGEYTLEGKIIDKKTGEDVSNHELMGKVELVTKVKTSSDSDYQEYPNGSKITLEADSSTEMVLEGTYLEDYTISTKDSPELEWLDSIEIIEPKVAFEIDAKVLQDQSWYRIKDHDKWKPIQVSMTIEGQPLTDEQLNQTQLNIKLSDKLSYRYEPILGESAYNIYIGQDENGSYVEPETGKYKMEISAIYVDSYGQEADEKDQVSFQIQTYSKAWPWLILIALILLIIALILWVALHRVFPKKITLHKKLAKGKTFDGNGDKQRVGKSFSLSVGSNIIFSGTAQKVTPYYKRKSSGATIKVEINKTGANVSNLKVGATRITATEREVTISDMDIVKFTNSVGTEKQYQIRINKF